MLVLGCSPWALRLRSGEPCWRVNGILDAQLFFLVSSFPLWSLGEIQNSLAIASPLKKRIKNVAIKKLRVLWVVLLMTTTGALRRTLLTLRGIRASTLATSSPTVSSTHFMFGLFGLFNALTIFYRSYAPAWECRQGRSAFHFCVLKDV